MGSCVSRSPASTAAVESGQRVATTAKVMDLDGSMAQYAAPVTAREALGDDKRRCSSCFICSSDELRFDAPARALGVEEALQAGQLYFVLPLSMLRRPLSGQDMAALAVKASSALAAGVGRRTAGVSSRRKSGVRTAGKHGKAARVAPLVVASSNNGGEPDGKWNDHARYGTRKSGDDTAGKTSKGVGYRSGTRHRRGVQRLSAISEASEGSE